MRAIQAVLDAQRGHLFLWVPVCLAIGIGGYFSLPLEPSLWGLAGCAAGLSLGGWLTWASPGAVRPYLLVFVLIAAGGGLAGLRANLVAEPVLSFRYYGPIEGRVVKIDRSGSDAVRLTLDQVVLRNLPPQETPAFVRVSMHGQQGFITPFPGMTVILTGHLAPPSGPVEPGGYDFQRQAWFQRLGGVGYTRTPVLTLRPAPTGWGPLPITRARARLAAHIRAQVPGETGAFTAAILTGDRSGISLETLENLRASNLAHLLAISGMHMGMLTGFVFLMLRYGLALIPAVALRYPCKKIAAVAALMAGLGYLALSGGNVATERAYVMVAVMFVAVLMDRRAVTLRSLAIAAVLILVLRPEVLMQPGFQMSFAATTALVAVFSGLRGARWQKLPPMLRPVAATVLSSAVAGAATAPIAAAHFNRFADYGLLANLAAVPLMGVMVMPGAVMFAVLSPFGMGKLGLYLMAPAIDWILMVAATVAGQESAVSFVPSPPAYVLPTFALCGLAAILWRGRVAPRGIFAAAALAALAFWTRADRPAVLISETGGLVGVMTAEGRSLSKPRGEGFAATSWLENDGDAALQPEAAFRAGFQGEKGALWFELADLRFLHITGRGAADRAMANCANGIVIVVSGPVAPPSAGCRIFDPTLLSETGAMAVYASAKGAEFVSAAEKSGRRLWNNADMRRRNAAQRQDMLNWLDDPERTDSAQYVRINPTKRP